jgi:hypothetical protein
LSAIEGQKVISQAPVKHIKIGEFSKDKDYRVIEQIHLLKGAVDCPLFSLEQSSISAIKASYNDMNRSKSPQKFSSFLSKRKESQELLSLIPITSKMFDGK